MARLTRLVLPGQAHYIIQRSHGGQAVLADVADREHLGRLITQAAAAQRVQLLAFALLDTEVQWLCTPPDSRALGHMMQTIGRRYVSTYNQRHGRQGTLWDGRFRCAVVEPGAPLLEVLCLVDGQCAASGDSLRTTAGQRTGEPALAPVTDPPEYWALGNTPFERERAYRERLAQRISPTRAQALRAAALGGWAIGSARFAEQVGQACGRPAAPRPRGRPRRSPG